MRRLSRASQDRVADSSAIASEVLNAIPVVQSYTAETREAERFTASTAQALGTALRRTRARSVLVGFIIMTSSAALLWGLYLGTLSVRAGTTTAGELGQTVVYVILLASAFAVLGEVYGDILRAAGATERLMELLHSQSDVQSPAHPQRAPWPEKGSSLVLRGVNFNYPSRPTQLALNGLTGEVRAGQTVAIVGPSGAGKTTLFSLLMRFHAPQNGDVLLDGVAVDHMDLNDLRHRIGVVPQEAVVFSGTVMENIRYGKPETTDEEVHAAAEAAFAQEFISELPQASGWSRVLSMLMGMAIKEDQRGGGMSAWWAASSALSSASFCGSRSARFTLSVGSVARLNNQSLRGSSEEISFQEPCRSARWGPSRQNSVRCGCTAGLALKKGSKFTPSMTRSVGIFPPAAATMVGIMSMLVTGCAYWVPAAMRPGHLAT